jgi:uncharacterized membrane protein (DUF4010 family)
MVTPINIKTPVDFTDFILVLVFSLLIGLSQRRLHLNNDSSQFGTDRTFTFIGLLGYLLYLLKPTDFLLFTGGGLSLIILLGIHYYMKINKQGDYGLTSHITALITYGLGPLISLTPSWLYVSVVVVVLLLAEMKSTFIELAQKMKNDEFITLAMFLLMSFIVLPMLPDKPFLPEISLTPYKIWLVTVIVSGISYVSYLLKRYVFQKSGILVSGIIGGLYSSTATITILSKQCKQAPASAIPEYAAGIFFAIGMMFLRLLIIIAIFNLAVFNRLLWPLIVMAALSCIIGSVNLYQSKKTSQKETALKSTTDQAETKEHPLEFKVALIFAFLFVLFTLLTHYAFDYLGEKGITYLALLSGFGDITPFILNLIEGHFKGLTVGLVTTGSLLAMLSNNLIKMGYAIGFSGINKALTRSLIMGFFVITLFNLALLLIINL